MACSSHLIVCAMGLIGLLISGRWCYLAWSDPDLYRLKPIYQSWSDGAIRLITTAAFLMDLSVLVGYLCLVFFMD